MTFIHVFLQINFSYKLKNFSISNPKNKNLQKNWRISFKKIFGMYQTFFFHFSENLKDGTFFRKVYISTFFETIRRKLFDGFFERKKNLSAKMKIKAKKTNLVWILVLLLVSTLTQPTPSRKKSGSHLSKEEKKCLASAKKNSWLRDPGTRNLGH